MHVFDIACKQKYLTFNKRRGEKKVHISQFVKDNSGGKITNKQQIGELPFKYKDTLKR